MRLIRRLLRRMIAINDWRLWSLPRWLPVFVLTVVAVDAAAIGVAASFTTITEHDLVLFGLLLGCTALAVELSQEDGRARRHDQGRPGRLGIAGRHLAASAVRADRPDRPDRADAVAGPALAALPPGVQRRGRSACLTAPRR